MFQDDYANETLLKHFNTKSLKGFGIEDLYEGIVASGAILHYLGETQHHQITTYYINSAHYTKMNMFGWIVLPLKI